MPNELQGREAEKKDIEHRTYIRESVNLLTLLTRILYGEVDVGDAMASMESTNQALEKVRGSGKNISKIEGLSL